MWARCPHPEVPCLHIEALPEAIQMHDPREGVTSHGTIATGASRDQVSAVFEPILAAAVAAVRGADRGASLYVYGSVATGTAQAGSSDVDLLAVGIPPSQAAAVGRALSERFANLCRAVEVAAAQAGDFVGERDEAYGGRVFLRHYCVHLTGPDLHSRLPDFPADVRAARGFNGDIGLSARRWRDELDGGDAGRLGRRLARKCLLAVAGLVSVYDNTWTTDRAGAAARWAEIEPRLENDLRMLLAWSTGDAVPDRPSVAAALDGVVNEIVASFEVSIGLWGAAGDT